MSSYYPIVVPNAIWSFGHCNQIPVIAVLSMGTHKVSIVRRHSTRELLSYKTGLYKSQYN